MLRAIRIAFHRRILKARVREWGDALERLEQARRCHEGNVAIATAEMLRAKRELSALDLPPPRVDRARESRGSLRMVDGTRRFSLVDDRPAR